MQTSLWTCIILKSWDLETKNVYITHTQVSQICVYFPFIVHKSRISMTLHVYSSRQRSRSNKLLARDDLLFSCGVLLPLPQQPLQCYWNFSALERTMFIVVCTRTFLLLSLSPCNGSLVSSSCFYSFSWPGRSWHFICLKLTLNSEVSIINLYLQLRENQL